MNDMTQATMAVAEELKRREIARTASEIETANYVRIGKRALYIGWCAPIIPMVGLAVLSICATIAFVLSIITMVKGNTNGGLKLLLLSWLGTAAVAIGWTLLYMVLGFSSMALF